MRDRLRSPLLLTALLAAGGALLSLGIGFAALGSEDASHLIVPLAIACVLTVAVTGLATRALPDASLRARFGAVAVFATAIGLVNLAVLTALMAVMEKDAILIGVLLVYSAAAAVGAGLAAARSTGTAIGRLADASRRIAAGDLAARAGSVGGGRELEALARDLDEMAARLERSTARAQAAEATRRDLIVAVSHDLRTPLAGLLAMTEAIEDGIVTDPATINDYTARMRESVASLSRLVDDLFEFVQLDADSIIAERRRAQLGDVVRSALAACDAQAAEKRLRVETEMDGAAELLCSPRLTRVLQNLLQNAIRHTPADGTVVVAARYNEHELELAVSDTGEGIAPEAVAQVFEPFWRGDSARAGEGSGLGLALAKRIVEALGGRIEVISDPERGSRFAVLLPAD